MVSIPNGSIKSQNFGGLGEALPEFQFQTVRLKVSRFVFVGPAWRRFQFQTVRLKGKRGAQERHTHSAFQFQTVRLKEVFALDLVPKRRRFNSKRFD